MHVPVPTTLPSAEGLAAQGWPAQPEQATPVGPQFPDLFQAALQGSHLADNVTVASAGPDAAMSDFFTSSRAGDSPTVGASSGGGSKRRWRKGS